MTGWQCHQLDHMQIICTSLKTDNHASTAPLKKLQPIFNNFWQGSKVINVSYNLSLDCMFTITLFRNFTPLHVTAMQVNTTFICWKAVQQKADEKNSKQRIDQAQ